MSAQPVTTPPRIASDFTDLAAIVQEAGLMRRRYGYYWAKLAAVPVVVAAAVVVMVWVGDSWWQLVTAAVFGLIFTQIAFLGHDAAHRQIFKSGRWNDWISLILGDLFVGMSYGWWRHKHTRHHANPNKEGADPDINVPAITFAPERVARHRIPAVRWLMAHQGLFFFPIIPLEGVSMHLSSIARVVSREHVDRRWVEICFILLRLGGFFALAFLVLSPGIAAAFLAVQLGVFGFYMAASFAPNHKGMPLVPADARIDFLRRQVLMSRNIRGSRLLDVAMGGLNYQIEHHLFPSMPRPHLRRAAPLVAEYCRSLGIPYTATSLTKSYAIVIRYIDKVGLGERDPFACPLVQQRRSL